MKIVSGRTGTPHVTSQQFRQILEGTVGQGSYILSSGENLEPELVSNNLLKIRSGMMCHHGNVACVEIGTYDEVELTNGNQGMKRIDLVVNRYKRNSETEIESNEWIVIQGTPVSSDPIVPSYTIGNLQDGDLVDDCPVIQITYDGLNVTEVKKLLSVVKNASEMENEIAELNSNLENKIKYVFKSVSCSNTARGVAYIDLSDVDFDLSKYHFISVQCTNVNNTNFYIHASGLNYNTKKLTFVYTSNANSTAHLSLLFVKA